jgi:magnesium chelatase accessory protein
MFPLSIKPDWTREGLDWPNRDASRFVFADGFKWHVQVMGAGPTLLMLHGAGAATHSWRDLAPLLAQNFTVIAPDLPGHGFTETPNGDGLSLRGMARGLSALLAKLDAEPVFAVGHSAGAAIAMQMARNGRFQGGVVSLNGALRPFPGAAGHIFPAMAKLLFLNPLAQQMFAWRAARPGSVARLIESTGSHIDEAGLRYYQALLSTTGHIAGALGMMARWDLHALQADLSAFSRPLTLVAADRDHAVPPKVAEEVKAVIPQSRLIHLTGLGHLAHEEDPARIAAIVRESAGV